MSKPGMPEQWKILADAEERRTGLPAGTLGAIVKQETGFQQRFLDDPAAAHYSVGPKGEKPKSSARGLGGTLSGTAENPGYGVTPLKDWAVPEQFRFMADYVAARAKQAGSLPAGLAGYGEGTKYAQGVMGNIDKGATVAQAAQQSPVQQAVAQPIANVGGGYPDVVEAPVPVRQHVPDEPMWQQFKQAMPEEPLQVADFNFGGRTKAMAEMIQPPVNKRKKSTVAATSGFGRFAGFM